MDPHGQACTRSGRVLGIRPSLSQSTATARFQGERWLQPSGHSPPSVLLKRYPERRPSCAPGEEDGQVPMWAGLAYELGQAKNIPRSCRHPCKHFCATVLSAQCLKFVSAASCPSSGTNSSGASLCCQPGFIYLFEMQIL